MKQRTRLLAILAEFSVFAAASCWTSHATGETSNGSAPAKSAPADASQETPPGNQPQELDQADISRAIADLASPKFRERQAAHQVLVTAGSLAVEPLEKNAKTSQFEAATRAIEILIQIARDAKSRDVALAALERLAKDPTNRIAKPAARAVKELNTTDEDRAIAALAADGVRMYRSSRGGVSSVTVVNDGQLALLKHFTKLRSVWISGQEVTDDGIERLADVKGLSNLTISGSSVTDVGLRKLRALASLDCLSLDGQFFTSDGLRHLQHVPKLRTLSLHSSIDESELGFLIDASQIDSLYLSDVRLSQKGIDTINQLDHLRRFTLSVSDVNDEQLRRLGQLEVPLNLSVTRSPDVTEAGWKHLVGTRLLSLKLRTPITDAGLAHVGTVRTLESLAICDVPISDAGLVYLQELKALASLTLRNTKVTDDGITRLRRSLPNLRHALIGAMGSQPRVQLQKQIHFTVNSKTGKKSVHLRTRLTAEHVEQLKKEPRLDTIFLTGGETKDDDLVLLANVHMKGLVIDSMHVTDRGVKALEDHPTLESLGLWSSSITDRSLESITRIRSLTKLTIQKAPITDEGVRGLIERLSDIGKLKSLNFFKCPRITSDGLKQIGRLTSLERLFLNNNDGLTSGLLKEIAHLKNLHRLELDSIALDEADLVHLTALTKLETLGLSCSNSKAKLTDRGLAYVSRLRSLQSLTIQDAKITDKGVSHLIQLKELQKLGLARTEITDQGVTALANELPNLLRLGLTGTKVTDSGMAHVGKLTKLEWLWLDETQVGDAGIRQLDRLTKLQYMYVNASKVSNEGHQRFRRAHPATRILLE